MAFPSSNARESSFGFWLRTGRYRTASGLSPTEVKFNPWHDFDTGQFTFSHSGRYAGLGGPPPTGQKPPYSPHGQFLRTGMHGQGGRLGGGGATGSYPAPAPTRPPPVQSKPAKTAPLPKVATMARALAKPVPEKVPPPKPASAPVQSHIENGHRFDVQQNRTVRVVAQPKLTQPPAPRSKKEQLRAGGAERKPTDDGGHFIAPRFGGPPKAFNHFAQDRSINRGLYRSMEDKWAAALKQGKPVYVEITPNYTGRSTRPDWLHVFERIGEIITEKIIPNMRQKPNGK